MRRHGALLTILALLTALAGPGIASGEEELTTRFFMRNDGGGCPGTPFLSTQAGANEPGCGYQAGAPVRELTHSGAPVGSDPRVFDSRDGLPVTLDATRDVAGNVRVVATATTERNAVGQVRVDVTVTARVGNQTISLGTHSSETIVYPTNSAETDFPFTIDVPDSHDGKRLTGLTATVDVRGWHVLTGYHRLNGQSWLDLPVHPEEDEA